MLYSYQIIFINIKIGNSPIAINQIDINTKYKYFNLF